MNAAAVHNHYSRIFDALHDLHASGADTYSDIQLHGNAAGIALRTWALARRFDIVSDIGELPDRTWSRLVLTLPGEVSWLVVVHLDDVLRLDGAGVPQSSADVAQADEMEIPF